MATRPDLSLSARSTHLPSLLRHCNPPFQQLRCTPRQSDQDRSPFCVWRRFVFNTRFRRWPLGTVLLRLWAGRLVYSILLGLLVVRERPPDATSERHKVLPSVLEGPSCCSEWDEHPIAACRPSGRKTQRLCTSIGGISRNDQSGHASGADPSASADEVTMQIPVARDDTPPMLIGVFIRCLFPRGLCSFPSFSPQCWLLFS